MNSEQYEKYKNIPTSRMKTNTNSSKINETRIYIEASNNHLTTIQIHEKRQVSH